MRCSQLMERLQNKHAFGLMAVSLGYADTLMSLSAASTSSELSDADKAAAALSDGYVRFSVGITGEAASQPARQHTAQLACSHNTHTHTPGTQPRAAANAGLRRRRVRPALLPQARWISGWASCVRRTSLWWAARAGRPSAPPRCSACRPAS